MVIEPTKYRGVLSVSYFMFRITKYCSMKVGKPFKMLHNSIMEIIQDETINRLTCHE